MSKIKLEASLYERALACAKRAGYSSVDEFVAHLVERALGDLEKNENADEQAVQERLRGLGYID